MTFNSLTRAQRHALILAVAQGVNPKNSTVKPETWARLEDLGLVGLASRKGRFTWRSTDKGRILVAQTGLKPVFLHRQSQHGYTSNPALAMNQEPEAFWKTAA